MKFIVDRMLGKLAKQLRMLGYDTLYYRGGEGFLQVPPLQRPSRSNTSEGGRGKGSGFHFSSAERILSMPSMPENLLAGVSSGEHAKKDQRVISSRAQCQMSNVKVQMKHKIQMSRIFWHLIIWH